ncbi:MAG TPA: penicillin-binding protein 2 [Pyrinomonadaceae bacterium]|nr:penicillin-binding protein 2 [Pyrinomonadaceae bacterium]
MRKPKRAKRNSRQVAFTRFMLVVAVFVLWIGGISARLVHLQVTQHAWLKERAVDIRQDVKQTRALRGTIFDRNARTLAMSIPVKTLYADATEIVDPAEAARAIARVLKVDVPTLTMQIRQAKEGNKRFLPIAKKLDDDVAQKVNKSLDDPAVKKADLPNFYGLHWREEQRRSYPNGTLAAQVVGFANTNDDGRAGIEMSQDVALHGAIIKTVQERDRLGRVFDETTVERDAPSDIVLTIDAAVQNIVETALETGVQNAQAKSGMAIAMDPKTGEILALANYPTFDPNTITEESAANIGNHAIQSVYSPGSVFKIVTYGSALERHMFRPDDMIDAGNGTIEVAKHKFSDHHTGRMTYSEALAHSSNICAIKTGLSVGKDDFWALLRKMGFGARTGIELPAETNGIVRSPEKWNGDSLASMSIGYEIGVTALQMTTAFATIANDGIRNQPHIIKEIRHSDEQPKTVTQVQQTQVVTADTARSLRTMMREVVLDGTGKRAALNGYSVAGKTGTAWKFNATSKSIDSSKYISSFIGMAPADDPRIVVAVVMDEPRVGARDGGMVSAPVFSQIAQTVLTAMNVPTDQPVKNDSLLATTNAPAAPATAPSPAVNETATSRRSTADKPAIDKKAKPMLSSPVNNKGKDLKKTNEKGLPGRERITAALTERYLFKSETIVET